MIEFSPHIAVSVRNYNDAVEFYTNVLGLKLSKKSPDESDLMIGDVTLHIENNESEQHTWLEFKVENAEKLKLDLLAAGCSLQKTHLQNSYLVVDPYGMRFHIWEGQ